MSKISKLNCINCKHCKPANALLGIPPTEKLPYLQCINPRRTDSIEREEGIVSLTMKDGVPFVDEHIISVLLVQKYYGCKFHQYNININ